MDEDLKQVADLIKRSDYIIAFTGAGASVESGIPPFRGSENALWDNYSPDILDISTLHEEPLKTWEFIRDVFYDYMFREDIKPNPTHFFLARLEKEGSLKAIVTQNIDNLHQEAGSKEVYEFHGSAAYITCTTCGYRVAPHQLNMKNLPPKCPKCVNKVLKPDFVFFGEGIPQKAYEASFVAARKCDLCIVIGTSGTVMPASMVPIVAKQNGATIVEIGPTPTELTRNGTTDIFLKGKSGEVSRELEQMLFGNVTN